MLERKTTLKRKGWKPSEPKPTKGIRKKTCKVCREKYEPSKPLQVACSVACAIEHGKKVTAAQKAKAQRQERAQDKARRERHKDRSDFVKEAQKAFNAYVRMRDADKPCICCGRTTTKVSGLYSHGWDCGHYRSTGSAPHLRFNEDNAHRQLVFCNRDRAGNAVEYRAGLIARIGLQRVEALEADNTPAHWSIEELRAIKAKYVTKLKELKRGQSDSSS